MATTENSSYKSTLNLPQTPFPMKANLAMREPEQLVAWESARIYHQSLRRNEGKPLYLLHDGPPYANGHIHLGTALNKILKDIVVKYKNMSGYYAPFIPGWDCHGLPIELQVDQSLGALRKGKSPNEIIKLCREYAAKYVDIQREEFKRLGIFADWEHPYLTMDPSYEAAILRALAKIAERGYIYRGKKPVHWCASCRTALAEAEVEYADRTSPSIYVSFRLSHPYPELLQRWADREISIIIWTTTPWTLPANMALAVHPAYSYVLVETQKGRFVVAKDLLDSVSRDCGLQGEAKILQTFKGEEMKGIVCHHPFVDRVSPVILGHHVTLNAGTGVVHTAPGHGQEDYVIGMENGLEVFTPVDEAGKFTKEYKDFEGQFVFDTNQPIIDLLEARGSLLASGKITHSYPHCWRCKKPVIFRGTEQWFLSMEHNQFREKVLKEIEKVEWVPDWGILRIRGMVESRPDWCLSRQRTWGVPIPSLHCNSCHDSFLDPRLIEEVAEHAEKEGAAIWFERSLQELFKDLPKCPACGSKDVEKETNILDVWFDSGASAISLLADHPPLHVPADLYLEGSDQHRGWFQTSLLLTMANRDQRPYQTVLTHGFTLDGEGRKMSKSLGNVIDPGQVMKESGADVLRLWISSEDYRNDVPCSKEILSRVSEVYRRIRNTFRFMLGNLYDFEPGCDALPYQELLERDRVMLHRLNQLIERCRKAYDAFEFHVIYHSVQNFCAVDLSAQYLDILKDCLYVSAPDDRGRRSAQSVLWHTTDSLSRLLAPILSFTAEEVWQALPGHKEESVFLTDLPSVQDVWNDDKLFAEWEQLLAVRNQVTKALEKARAEEKIGNSLEARVAISSQESALQKLLTQKSDLLAELFIVSQVDLAPSKSPLPLRERERVRGDLLAELAEEGLSVTVFKADGQKCPRCWIYSSAVGSASDLCTRCSKGMAQLRPSV